MAKPAALAAIVMPCFNSGRYIKAAVASALAQTYTPLECIIVDDGSTDPETLAELSSIETLPRTTVIRTANRGAPAARNTAIRATAATYILPLDADDMIEPSYVAEAVAILEANVEVGLVYCLADLMTDGVRRPWHLPDFSMKTILLQNLIFVSAVYRRADWEAAGGYDEELVLGKEDHDFNLKILNLGRTVHRIDAVRFTYRQAAGSHNSLTGDNRANLVTVSARRFRNNLHLYDRHAEEFFDHIYDLVDQRNDLAHRYAALERLRLRHGRLWRAARVVRRVRLQRRS